MSKSNFKPQRIQTPLCFEGHTIRLNVGQEFNIELDPPDSKYGDAKWEVTFNSNFFHLSEIKVKSAHHKRPEKLVYCFVQDYDLTDWAKVSNVYLGRVNVCLKKSGICIEETKRHICAFLSVSNSQKDHVVTVVNPRFEQKSIQPIIKLEPDQILEFVGFEVDDDPALDWAVHTMPLRSGDNVFRLECLYEQKVCGEVSLVKGKDKDSFCIIPRAIEFDDSIEDTRGLNYSSRSEHHFWYSFKEEDLEKVLSLTNGSYPAVNIVLSGRDDMGNIIRVYRCVVHLTFNSRARKRFQKGDAVYSKKEDFKLINIIEPFGFVYEGLIANKWSGAHAYEPGAWLKNPRESDMVTVWESDFVLRIAIPRPNFEYGTQYVGCKWNIHVDSPESFGKQRINILEKPEVLIRGQYIQLFEISKIDNYSPNGDQNFLGDIQLVCNNEVKDISLFLEPRRNKTKSTKPIYVTQKQPYGPQPASLYNHNIHNHHSHSAHNHHNHHNNKKRFGFYKGSEGYSQVELIDEYFGEEVLGDEEVVIERVVAPYTNNRDHNYGYEWDEEVLPSSSCAFSGMTETKVVRDEVHEIMMNKKKDKLELTKNLESSIEEFEKIFEGTTNDIPAVYNPLNNERFTIGANEVLVIRMVAPEVLFMDKKYQNHLWSMNNMENLDQKNRFWAHENKCEVICGNSCQEFRVSVIPAKNQIVDNQVNLVGVLYLTCLDQERILFVSFDNKNSNSCKLNTDRLFSIGSPELCEYIPEKDTFRVIGIKKTSNYYDIDPTSKFELLLPCADNERWDLEFSNKRDYNILDNSIFKTWDGKIFHRILMKFESKIRGGFKKLISQFTVVKIIGDKRTNYGYVTLWSAPPVVKSNFSAVYINDNCSRGKDLYINNWNNKDTIVIQPEDRLCIDLPDIKNLINPVKGSVYDYTWHVAIRQNHLSAEVVKKMVEKHGKDILGEMNMVEPWFSHNILGTFDPTSHPTSSRYLLRSLLSYQPRLYDILDCIDGKKHLDIGRIIFNCNCEDYTISRELNLQLIEPMPEKGEKEQEEENISDPPDHHTQKLSKDSVLTITVPKKVVLTSSTRHEMRWKLVECPPFIVFLSGANIDGDNQKFKFAMTKNAMQRQGRIVFKCGELTKRINLEIS